ncbi:MAG: methyltransferase domain-containing protein, partial [Ignavibacteriales bacterium]|nr:methyltransferase domain-containing protein [Ignavibacteriales bacterium]
MDFSISFFPFSLWQIIGFSSKSLATASTRSDNSAVLHCQPAMQSVGHLIERVKMDSERNRVCPVEYANSLDSKIRKWLQNPKKILAPYVQEGMTVLDIGCGPGFFSIEMAKMVGKTGKVISADLQEGMLQ